MRRLLIIKKVYRTAFTSFGRFSSNEMLKMQWCYFSQLKTLNEQISLPFTKIISMIAAKINAFQKVRSKKWLLTSERLNHTTTENVRLVLNNERFQPAKILSASNVLPKLVLPFWQNLERKKINTEKCRTLSFWLSFFPYENGDHCFYWI